MHLYYAAPETSDRLRAKNTEQWKGVFVEDIHVVEGMQAARGAPGFDGGRFSPAMDGPTHCFHAWVAARMGGQAARAPHEASNLAVMSFSVLGHAAITATA